MTKKVEPSTVPHFLTTVQGQNRVRLTKEVVELFNIKQGDIVEVTVKKVEKK